MRVNFFFKNGSSFTCEKLIYSYKTSNPFHHPSSPRYWTKELDVTTRPTFYFIPAMWLLILTSANTLLISTCGHKKKKTAADQSLAHSSFNWNTEMQIFQALKTDERIMHIDLNCACHKLCTGSHSSSRIGFVVLASLNITRCSCSSKRKRGVS